MLSQAEELGGIPDESLFMTVSFYSWMVAGNSRGPAPVDVFSVFSERPTEMTGQASLIFSYDG